MATRKSIDVEAFQTFLSNAFAVQESGLERNSLCSLIEIQRFIASGEFDLDRAMGKIVDHVLLVADATGVAIGLVEINKNELVYKAACGSAAQDVGRHVPAVLSSSSPKEKRREILRVENAESDARIEAEICRQFGATALLMLPIYRGQALFGVLQVLFNEAHLFHDRELRAYRLMIAALEEGLLPENILQSIPRSVSSKQNPRPSDLSAQDWRVPAAAARHDIARDLFRRKPESFPKTGTKSVSDYPAKIVQEMDAILIALKTAVRRLAARQWGANLRGLAASIGVVVLLGMSISIFRQSGRRETKIHLPDSTAHDVALQTPVKAVLKDGSTNFVNNPSIRTKAHNGGFRRVLIGPNEVDYVADDVTIRRFETGHAKSRLQSGATQVNLGDDVTMRYFAKTRDGRPSSNAIETGPEN